MAKRCVGCMKMKNSSPICEHCGYNENIPNLPHELPIGTMLRGQYLVGKELGQGGFGITYIGWDCNLDIPVAIKEYYPNSMVSRECSQSLTVHCSDSLDALFQNSRARFLREARALARLRSVPGIVDVYNFFEENNTAYIIMEYVQGMDLKQYIRQLGRTLTPAEALCVLRPVMQVLNTVHQEGLVHRDISPDNIMILPDGSAKLLDFGAVREVGSPEVEKMLSQSTDSILKHGFAPIEQYQRRGNLGPWTDVYALCATAYYCLTGTVPPDAPERMIEQEPVQWESIRGLNGQQIAAFSKGMELLPQDRLHSVKELSDALFGQTVPVPPVPPVPPAPPEPPVPPTPPKPKPKKKLWIAAAAAVLIGAILLMPKGKETPKEEPAPSIPQQTIMQTEPALPTQAVIIPEETEAEERTIRQIAAGLNHTVALYSDGTVKATGRNDFRQCNVDDWKDIIAISTLTEHTVGLKKDGTVVAVGNNEFGQCNVDGWTDIIAIAAGKNHTVGLRSNGTVVTVGSTDHGVDQVQSWNDIIDIKATYSNTIGLCEDGTVIVAGSYSHGKISGWSNIIAIDASDAHFVGLTGDGKVKAAGSNSHKQCKISEWSNIMQVGAGCGYTIGVTWDKTVIIKGLDDNGQHAAAYWTNVVSISAGLDHIVGIKADGTLLATGDNEYGECNVSKLEP